MDGEPTEDLIFARSRRNQELLEKANQEIMLTDLRMECDKIRNKVARAHVELDRANEEKRKVHDEFID
jgi:hypothetical protein